MTTIDNYNKFNPYQLGNQIQRQVLSKGVNEMMFYSNLNTGELIPWQGLSWEYNSDFTEITLHLRHDVFWSDGHPFTSADVVYTLNLLDQAGPTYANIPFQKSDLTSVKAVDDYTVKIQLSGPNPLWFWRTFAIAQEDHVPMMPAHIWSQQSDPSSFTFYDPAKGWPVSTGAYTVKLASPTSIVLSRNPNWWAAKAGFHALPNVQQIDFIPLGTDQTAPTEMLIQNKLDEQILQVGDFETAVKSNPNLRSWADKGPVWGPPDGCVYRLALNNAAPPFDNVDVRWALDHAIDRQKISTLAYEGSNSVVVMPFSSYGGVQKYISKIQDLINANNPDDFDLSKVASLMGQAGYEKDSAGFWAKDGKQLTFTVETPSFLSPIAPVLVQQLRTAGFDAISKVFPSATGERNDMMIGNFTANVEVHCGSLQSPFDTLYDFDSVWSRPIGTQLPYVHASTRYSNPAYDAIMAKMKAMEPNPQDPTYIDLLRQATTIWLKDLPEIDLLEERHVNTFNQTYWTNWATASNPYAAPFFCCWESPYMIVLDLKPTQ